MGVDKRDGLSFEGEIASWRCEIILIVVIRVGGGWKDDVTRRLLLAEEGLDIYSGPPSLVGLCRLSPPF